MKLLRDRKQGMKMIVKLIFSIAFLLITSNSWAWTPPVPEDAEQFTCYEFGLPADNTWAFPDQCYSFSLGLDPFAGGLATGKVAYITDFISTPTSTEVGSYYIGVAQSTTVGNNFNPQLFFRGAASETFNIHNTAPLLTITAGNTIRFYNSATSPGSTRIMVQGYIADIPTDGHPFSCYEFGLPDNNTWTFPDQCYSWTLQQDPFAGGLLANHRAVITDVSFSPTTVTASSYYVGVAQSTIGGNNSNPQIFMRASEDQSVYSNQTAPLLVISPGNTIRFYNSTTSPGSIRAYAWGFIVSNEAFFGAP